MSKQPLALRVFRDYLQIIGARIGRPDCGADLIMAECPFHDPGPNFKNVGMLYTAPGEKFIGCTVCDWTGDLVQFIADIERISRRKARAMLRDREFPDVDMDLLKTGDN